MNDRLLLRYIMGKSSRSERRQVIAWINESPDNMSKYAALKARFVFSGMPNDIIPERRNRIPRAAFYAAAALALPLLAGTIYLYINRKQLNDRCIAAEKQVAMMIEQSDKDVTYITNPGTKSIVVLPDSSIVHLNGDSRLVAPGRFNPRTREVFLSGEGYFEVKHHDEWPMRVQTPSGVVVKVLGTTFNLSAYSNDPDVRLTLIEGKVQVQKPKSSAVMEIKPNQEIKIATAVPDDPAPRIEAAPVVQKADVHKNTGWVNGELIFDNTPMPEIVRQLERWYGVSIHILDEDVMKYHLTASFTTESITRVMDLMKFSSSLDYEINGSDIFITRSKNR